MWMRAIVTASLTALCAGGSAAAQDATRSVLLVEDLFDDGVCKRRQLVAVHVPPEGEPRREVLLVRDQRFFGHFGRHRLVAGRYFVSKFGAVYDTVERKLLQDLTHGRLVGVDDADGSNPVVVYRGGPAGGALATLALDTGERGEVRAPSPWLLPGALSPNRTRSAEINPLGELWVQELDGSRRRVAAELGLTLSRLSSSSPLRVPVLWLDDATVLTQTDNGVLCRVQVDEEKIRGAVDIVGPPEPVSPPTLTRDAEGRVVYECAKSWVLDVDAGRATPREWIALGDGFRCEVEDPEGDGRVLQHDGVDLDRLRMTHYMTATAPGWVATPGHRPDSNENSPDRLLIWRADRRTWSEVEARINWVVGWLAP